jgi:hypothetical protein
MQLAQILALHLSHASFMAANCFVLGRIIPTKLLLPPPLDEGTAGSAGTVESWAATVPATHSMAKMPVISGRRLRCMAKAPDEKSDPHPRFGN